MWFIAGNLLYTKCSCAVAHKSVARFLAFKRNCPTSKIFHNFSNVFTEIRWRQFLIEGLAKKFPNVWIWFSACVNQSKTSYFEKPLSQTFPKLGLTLSIYLFLFPRFNKDIKKATFLYGIVYFKYVNDLATYLCAVHFYVLFSHKKLHFFWYRWRSYHEYLVQGQFLIVAIATIGIMEKYTGQTFIIDTYEKNDNNSMRLDPLCNFCLHFQISGAGVNIVTVAQRPTFYHNLSDLPH